MKIFDIFDKSITVEEGMMSNQRRLSMFISLIVFIATLSLVVAALFTDYWTESRPINSKFSSANNYVNSGLFRGSRQLDWGLGVRYKPFSVYTELHDRVGFMSKVYWMFIIFFLALGILWNAVAAIVTLLNTVTDEADSVAGPKGILLWSILTMMSNGFALITFLIQYLTTIRNNVLLSEHISNGFSTENQTRLGFSFYFVVVALALLPIPFLLVYVTSSRKSRNEEENGLSIDNTVFMY